MALGAVLAASRKGLQAGASQAQRRLLVTLEIPSRDRAHPWFLQWMGAQAKAQAMRNAGLLPNRKESFREFLGLTRASKEASAENGGQAANVEDPLQSAHGRASPVRIYSHDLSVETTQTDDKKTSSQMMQSGQGSSGDSKSREARFAFVPGPGTHFFRYKGTWMRLRRERNERVVDLKTGAPWETVSLTTLRSHQHLFTELLAEARQLALTSNEGTTTIFTAWGTDWRPFGLPRRARDIGSVVLAGDKRAKLESDVKRFMTRGWWYAERGIPYRRGYLLHGSPGSGKSSFIYALAGALDMSICLLNLSDRGLTDDKLNYLLSNAPERSILLLEDVDSAFLGRQRAREADGYQANVTFSGLLNSLDGVASSESRIVFMTTNHVERLDPALIRPGRVDYIEELGDAEYDQVIKLFMRFYGRPLSTAANVAARVDGKDTAEQASNTSSKSLQYWAVELADAINAESVRRRRMLGLDDEGRMPSAAATTSSEQDVSMRQEEPPLDADQQARRRASRILRLLPAARGGVSMAELQGLFIQFPDDGPAAVEAFKGMSHEAAKVT